MFISLLKSKIHRATVTQAELSYVGSITVDAKLLEESKILPGEKVLVVDNNNGNRFETYTIEGKRNSGIICLNGAAARQVCVGDEVIIMAYGLFLPEEARTFEASIVFVDKNNKVTDKCSCESND